MDYVHCVFVKIFDCEGAKYREKYLFLTRSNILLNELSFYIWVLFKVSIHQFKKEFLFIVYSCAIGMILIYFN